VRANGVSQRNRCRSLLAQSPARGDVSSRQQPPFRIVQWQYRTTIEALPWAIRTDHSRHRAPVRSQCRPSCRRQKL